MANSNEKGKVRKSVENPSMIYAPSISSYLLSHPNFTGHLVSNSNIHGIYKKGYLHNLDGPAVYNESYEVYYIDGVRHTKEEYIVTTRKYRLEKVLAKIDNDNS